MNRVSTSKMLIATTGALLSLGSLAGCSGGDDTEQQVPVGGINGPARVDLDSGGANNGESDD